MKKLIALIAVPGLLLTTGCGNVCTRAESNQAKLEEKTKACASGGQQTEKFDVAACEKDLESCTADDQAKMNKQIDCLEKVPNCEAGKELEFFAELAKCSENIGTVSDACAKALAE